MHRNEDHGHEVIVSRRSCYRYLTCLSCGAEIRAQYAAHILSTLAKDGRQLFATRPIPFGDEPDEVNWQPHEEPWRRIRPRILRARKKAGGGNYLAVTLTDGGYLLAFDFEPPIDNMVPVAPENRRTALVAMLLAAGRPTTGRKRKVLLASRGWTPPTRRKKKSTFEFLGFATELRSIKEISEEARKLGVNVRPCGKDAVYLTMDGNSFASLIQRIGIYKAGKHSSGKC